MTTNPAGLPATIADLSDIITGVTDDTDHSTVAYIIDGLYDGTVDLDEARDAADTIVDGWARGEVRAALR